MHDSSASESAAIFLEYVAECEEHLNAAGQALLELESKGEQPGTESLNHLFRNFHTIKGLSGMVGLREAERLAHYLESYLGAIRKKQTALTAAGVGVLVEGVTLLERVIDARRMEIAIPDVEPLIARVMALLPTAPESPGPVESAGEPSPAASAAEQAVAALKSGLHVWRVLFVPSPALMERGITVNVIRERLSHVGTILHAEPAVVPGGVTFRFLVATREANFAAMSAEDGLTVEPFVPVAAPQPGPRATSLASANLVRVDLGRLDDLMRTVGELVITRARLDLGLERVSPSLPAAVRRELQETSHAIERQLRELRDGVMRVRLVPVRDVFYRMKFVVRDLARESDKDIDLHLTGEGTEVDKFVVERLADPLLHLIRNAVSHGLEPSAERLAAGKPPRGRIDLRAVAAGGAITVEVDDDGRGIDASRIYARARAVGLIGADVPEDPAGVLDLLCAPGFSTRERADHESGRGVGLDVVARSVADLGGDLSLATRPGAGTRFTIRLPVTLAIADALIVTIGPHTSAVPQASVREVVAIESGTTTVLENNELLSHRGRVLPLLRLSQFFGAARGTEGFALIIGEGNAAVALGVDRVVGLREVVVRPLSDPLVQVPGIAGATELGDGHAVLILDTPGLARAARSHRTQAFDASGG